MRETLSKRPKMTSKPKAKATVADNRAKAKLRTIAKPKSSSLSKLSSPKSSVRSTTKAKAAKTAAVKQSKSAKKTPVKKKVVTKVVKQATKRASKPEIKSTAKKTLVAKALVKRGATASRAKVKATKTRVKAPAKAAVRVKGAVKAPVSTRTARRIGKTTAKVRQTKVTAKKGQKLVLPIKISPPPPPEPPRRVLPSGALRAFEHAVRVFNRRQFEDAKTMFENLLAKFPNEVEITARSQMYIQVCKQKLSHSQFTPRNADELYDRGVYALNLGDFSQAKNFFEKALRLKPDEPHLLYSLAAAHAQTGSLDQALDYLRQTIQLQPRYRTQALNDSDFSGLRENKQFLELLGLASPFDLLQSRR